MSYSLTRFAIYETVRDMMGSKNQGPMPFYQKVLLGAFGGVTPPNTDTHTHTNCVRQPQTFSLSMNRIHWRIRWNASRHGERQVRRSASSRTCLVSYVEANYQKKNNPITWDFFVSRMQNDMKLPPELRRK